MLNQLIHDIFFEFQVKFQMFYFVELENCSSGSKVDSFQLIEGILPETLCLAELAHYSDFWQLKQPKCPALIIISFLAIGHTKFLFKWDYMSSWRKNEDQWGIFCTKKWVFGAQKWFFFVKVEGWGSALTCPMSQFFRLLKGGNFSHFFLLLCHLCGKLV